MQSIETEILVIGGGSTGLGVVRDAARRGLRAVLVEKGDLANGTTGRFHGLLHSGGRYVVKDPVSAKECIEENFILRRVAADCIEDTGGLFVSTPFDDPNYGDEFVRGCRVAGIPVQEISPDEALKREPRLNPKISRAFVVPDAAMDSFKTLWANARDAQAHGAQILNYHRVTRLTMESHRVTGAVVQDVQSGEEKNIRADFVVNAAGPWAGQIAALAGINVNVIPGKGIMIAMNHRLVQSVINRCKLPADGDIIVPIRTVSVIGTTDVRVANPDDLPIEQWEIDLMLDEGEKLIPGFRQARALRVWAGARPLFQEGSDAQARETRDVTRTMALLDHAQRDDVENFITITGGKLTTYRLMAERTVDAVCRHLKVERKCDTATAPLPDSEQKKFYWLPARLAQREEMMRDDQLVCECELITRRRLEEAFAQRDTTDLDDIRRTLRLGMGPCQGGFCIYRATGILHAARHQTNETANAALKNFLQERWKGVRPLLWGDQLRQARLDDYIFQNLLDAEHLP